MTKILLVSENKSSIENLVSNSKSKVNDAILALNAAYNSCPSDCGYKNNIGAGSSKLSEIKSDTERIEKWFGKLVTRNNKVNEDSKTRIAQMEDIIIKIHDIYVK